MSALARRGILRFVAVVVLVGMPPVLQAGDLETEMSEASTEISDEALSVAAGDPRGLIALATPSRSDRLFAGTASDSSDVELRFEPGGHGTYPQTATARIFAGSPALTPGCVYLVAGLVIGEGTVSLLEWIKADPGDADAILATYLARAEGR